MWHLYIRNSLEHTGQTKAVLPSPHLRAMKNKKWIQDAINPTKKGALREAMGAKEGKNIPKGKLAEAAKKKGVTGQRARLAQTLASFNKKKKKQLAN